VKRSTKGAEDVVRWPGHLFAHPLVYPPHLPLSAHFNMSALGGWWWWW